MRYSLKHMTTLQVDPGALRGAAGALAGDGHDIGTQSLTQSLGSAAHGMAGLQTGPACMRAATAFDGEFTRLGAQLAAVAQNLRKAADSYEATDAGAGQNVKNAGNAFG